MTTSSIKASLVRADASVPACSPAKVWKPATAPIMTPWGEQLEPDAVWQEYPRPQMVRKQWQNLNGLWDFAVVDKDADPPSVYEGCILVPFPLESSLSGIRRLLEPSQALWYRRSVRISGGVPGQRVMLNFGGVDWDATVWVNGTEVGANKGMHAWWSCDITEALDGQGQAEIIVRVLDSSSAGSQPRGKQRLELGGIWYTRASGIWQTVWTEVVPAEHITALVAEQVASLDGVEVTVKASGGRNQTVTVTMSENGTIVASVRGKAGERLKLNVANPKLWSPDSPHLYDLTAILEGGDIVTGYTAVRWCEIGKDEQGINRLLINGKPLFQYGPLDQGWWPDGLITPPSDDAMVYDLQFLKSIGCNMLRKHIKIEPARYYYACDKLGIMVWQDFPSGDSNRDDEARVNFKREVSTIVEQLRGFPCIVMWVVFNEGWGQFDAAGTHAMTAWTKSTDPRRIVSNASGGRDELCGEVIDLHNYAEPNMLPVESTRVSVLGEYGGLGLPVKDHLWRENSWGYQKFNNAADLEDSYRLFMRTMRPLIAKGLSGAVYTQTTDVEGEVNGWLTYDRKVSKIPVETLAALHASLYTPAPLPLTLVAASDSGEAEPAFWRWTTTKPDTGWETPGFDDASWTESPAGFGTAATPGAVVRTEWKTDDIWLRRHFTYDGRAIKSPAVNLYPADDAEVYINGELVSVNRGHASAYIPMPIKPDSLKLNIGDNVLSVHCHHIEWAQFIDVGLIDLNE